MSEVFTIFASPAGLPQDLFANAIEIGNEKVTVRLSDLDGNPCVTVQFYGVEAFRFTEETHRSRTLAAIHKAGLQGQKFFKVENSAWRHWLEEEGAGIGPEVSHYLITGIDLFVEAIAWQVTVVSLREMNLALESVADVAQRLAHGTSSAKHTETSSEGSESRKD